MPPKKNSNSARRSNSTRYNNINSANLQELLYGTHITNAPNAPNNIRILQGNASLLQNIPNVPTDYLLMDIPRRTPIDINIKIPKKEGVTPITRKEFIEYIENYIQNLPNYSTLTDLQKKEQIIILRRSHKEILQKLNNQRSTLMPKYLALNTQTSKTQRMNILQQIHELDRDIENRLGYLMMFDVIYNFR